MNKEVITKVLNNEDENYISLFNLYYVSLISSDTCISTEACETNLSRLHDLKKIIKEIKCPEEIKKEYLQRIDLGISIVEDDIEALKNGDMGC